MRLIDADALYDFLTEQLEKETGAYSKGRNAGINIVRSALHDKTITPTITPPPNDPLTLEELREMEDEPIYIDYGKFVCSSFVNEVLDDVIWIFDKTEGFLMLPTSTLGKDWFAYRRNPEKEHNGNG